MRIVHDVEQRSAAWDALRAVRLCGTDAADMLAKRQDGKPAAGRAKARAKLVLGFLTGRSSERKFTSAAMQDGIDREADALAAYEALTLRLVRPVGFVSRDDLPVGCSPDGVIGDFEGIVEAKSPEPHTHMEYLLTGKVPKDYRDQVVHNLFVTGANWCDWLSFNPFFPEEARVKLVRIDRDEKEIAAYAKEVEKFLAEVEAEIATFRTVVGLKGTLERAVAV